MTKAELCTIISRIFALYFFTAAFLTVPNSGIYLFMPSKLGAESSYLLALFIFQFIGYGVMAAFFWFGAEPLGKAIAGGKP